MKIKILGIGCARCKQLAAEAQKAIVSAGMPVELEEIMKYRIMMTPALVLDEEVKAAGRIPTSAEIVSWIRTAAAKASA